MNIKKNAEDILSVWKDVFTRTKYIFISVFILVAFYFLNFLIANYNNLSSVYSNLGLLEMIKIFPVYFFGFRSLLLTHSIVTMVVIGVLLGMLVSLIYYKTTMLKSASGKTFGFFGTTGIFLGILAPGCAACGIGLLAVLGIGSSFIGFLPYQGLELSYLSIVILSFALIKISKDIKKGIVCEVE